MILKFLLTFFESDPQATLVFSSLKFIVFFLFLRNSPLFISFEMCSQKRLLAIYRCKSNSRCYKISERFTFSGFISTITFCNKLLVMRIFWSLLIKFVSADSFLFFFQAIERHDGYNYALQLVGCCCRN